MKTETKLEENDIILCKVIRLEGTTVFLELVDYPGIEGTMIFSEVSPGRIRNIREYVSPNKKIVCKVLRLKDEHPQLSLRRVTAKEREEVLDRYKKEKVLTNMIQPILKEKTSSVLEKIKEKYDVPEFLDEAREKPEIISKFVPAEKLKELEKIFASAKKDREKEVKKILIITSQSSSGLSDIQKTLKIEGASVYYLGSSKFSISIKATDYKTANSEMEEIIDQIQTNAKKHNVNLEVKEK